MNVENSSKVRTLLRVVYFATCSIEILKMVELLVVFTVKRDPAVVIVLIAIISSFFAMKKYRIFPLSIVLISNFILIFVYNIINQHFAFITSILTIYLLDSILNKSSMTKMDIDRTIALLLVAQLSILYLFAAIWKINLDYFTGTQMLQHIRSFLIFPSIENPMSAFYISLSIIGVIIESLLAFQFLYGQRILVPIQSVGFIFHVILIILIGEDIRNTFQLILFASICLAIYPLCDFTNWREWKTTVFWDEGCTFCRKSVSIFQLIDQSKNFEFVSNMSLDKYGNLPFDANLTFDTIIVYDSQSSQYLIKSKAIFFIISNTYFFWFLKPLIKLPIVFIFTDKLYDRVARARTCHI